MFLDDRRSLWIPTIMNAVVQRCMSLCVIVVLFGTAGYTWIEGWSPWQSLFFTLVTLSTVGYGDYGLSESGERFTAILMIGGIATVSYSISQLFQHATACAMQPEKRMMHAAQKLKGHHIVCGLGRTGVRVIDRLRSAGHTVVAIDSDLSLVERIREDGVIALTGDATSDDMLQNAGIQNAASVAAVTSSDAANAMICLSSYALAPEVPIIARAEETASVQKLRRAGAAVVVNPTEYGGDGVAQSMQHPEIAKLLFDPDKPECTLRFAELLIDASSPYLGQSVECLGKANPDLVIVAAKTECNSLSMRPNGKRVLGEGDVLVIAGTSADVEQVKSFRRAA